jgi:UDP-glucose 4-epimerase
MTSKKVLVTGGAGFIGSHLVRKLLDSDYTILVVDDLSVGRRDLLPPSNELKFVKLNIGDENSLCKVLSKFRPNIVIHLAAIHFIPFCNANPQRTFEVNVLGTRNLLECCRRIKPETLIYTSSATVYKDSSNPLTEDSSTEPIDIYGMTKLVGEDLFRCFQHEEGIGVRVLRLSNVYGPNDLNPHVIPEIVRQLKSGGRVIKLGDLSTVRDFIYVDDVVEAIMRVIGRTENDFDIFNVGTGEGHSVKEILNIIEELIRKELHVNVEKNKLRKHDKKYLVLDVKKIQRVAGWAPKVELKQGLRRLLEKDV